ncbi:MAG: hypothetical protein MJY43_04310 [Bacteroidales bacterium]|nr:hypothetical protein [Bacteroidales bacterium]
MKDIILKASSIKRELVILLCCFAAAELLNLAAVIFYSRPAIELLSMIGYVIVFSIITYLLLWIPRLVALLIKKISITR